MYSFIGVMHFEQMRFMYFAAQFINIIACQFGNPNNFFVARLTVSPYFYSSSAGVLVDGFLNLLNSRALLEIAASFHVIVMDD